MSLQILQDRRDIHDLVLEYCRAVDRGDWAGVRAVYAEDGRDWHTGFDGTADEFVRWLPERAGALDGTMHVVANHLSEVRGDRAFAETYGTAVHWGTPTTDPRLNFTSGFRYLDGLRRDEGGWKIVSRIAVREWTRSDAGRLMSPEGDGPRGSRGTADLLYTARARAFEAGHTH